MNHRVRRVFEAGPLRVDLCDCGEVHLHIDRTTVHLRDDDVRRLLEGLGRAADLHRAARPAWVRA